MRRIVVLFLVAASINLSVRLPSRGQRADERAGAASRAADNSQQPKPEDVLRRMSDYLAGLPAFSCRVTSTIDLQAQGLDNRMETKIEMRVERPNRLSLIVAQGVMGVTVVSNGAELYQYVPIVNRYTVREAPEDFSGLNEISGTLGIPMLGESATLIPTDGQQFYETLTEGVTGSEYVGSEKVGDVLCHHCRFTRDEFSWDIWVETGDRPLVHKLVPDLSKQFEKAQGALKGAKLTWSVAFSDWDVSPKYTAADFAFTPPAGAEKVESLAEIFGGAQESPPHPLLGENAPSFETTDLEGKPIALQKQLGKNIILLDFWATWCGPCVRAMPDVDAVAEKFADRGLVFYAVNVGEDPAAVKDFLTENKLDVPVALDADGAISEKYKVEALPQTVLVGKDGRVQVVHLGFSSALGKELEKNIEDLLAGKDLASEALGEAGETDEATP
jgi:peroxiredoxin